MARPEGFEPPTLCLEATVFIAISLIRLGSAYLLCRGFMGYLRVNGPNLDPIFFAYKCNFFGIHRSATGSTGPCQGTPTGTIVSGFPASSGFLLSRQAFAAQWGSAVAGITDPSAFAAAIPTSFNTRQAPGGNPDFNSLASGTINGVTQCVPKSKGRNAYLYRSL